MKTIELVRKPCREYQTVTRCHKLQRSNEPPLTIASTYLPASRPAFPFLTQQHYAISTRLLPIQYRFSTRRKKVGIHLGRPLLPVISGSGLHGLKHRRKVWKRCFNLASGIGFIARCLGCETDSSGSKQAAHARRGCAGSAGPTPIMA